MWGLGLRTGDLKSLLVEGFEFADVRYADEDYDGDCGGVFGEAHAYVFVEDGAPVVGCGEGYGDEEGADAAEDGVKEGGEGGVCVGSLELLDTRRC